MNEFEKKLFTMLSEKLRDVGYDAIDEEVLERYVKSIRYAKEAEAELDKHGLMMTDTDPETGKPVGKPYPNPAFKMHKEACGTINVLAKAMGINAYARKVLGKQVKDQLPVTERFNLK